MLEVVSSLIISLITHILDCYVFSKLIKEKFKLNFKNWIIIILFSIIDCIVGVSYDNTIKLITTNLITFIIFKYVYNKSISKTLIGTLFTYIGYIVAELLFGLVFIQILGIKESFLLDNINGNIFTNIVIFIFYIVIYSIKAILNIVSKIIDWYDENKVINIIFTTIIAILLCYIFIFQISYNKVTGLNELLISLIILVGTIIFIFGYFKEKSDNNRLNIEYDNLLEYSKTYEDEVVSKGKQQHEYRNQLIVLDDMIPKTNKKAKEYIRKIINSTEKELDKGWLVKLRGIPTGGIKGLIHFKIKKMIDNGIDVYVDVDKNLAKKKKWIYDNNVLEDISKIVGVYLDNAIEASMKTKDKQIIIEFTGDENIILFKLSNTYEGLIDFQHMDNERFSTKGKGRGYGLPLVKDIINKNNFLSQKREIDGKFFVQKLYIKIKK